VSVNVLTDNIDPGQAVVDVASRRDAWCNKGGVDCSTQSVFIGRKRPVFCAEHM